MSSGRRVFAKRTGDIGSCARETRCHRGRRYSSSHCVPRSWRDSLILFFSERAAVATWILARRLVARWMRLIVHAIGMAAATFALHPHGPEACSGPYAGQTRSSLSDVATSTDTLKATG